ncbi:MAG: ABC transporter ATP-binding protein, partial [Aquincola sp.]|nr:ABC transporter ATP-binding protein [Aquincola sp.]
MSGLEVEELSKRFGAFTAVDRVSLNVPKGSFVCLLGPSGCGKTTLLRMVAGLEEPSEGRVRLEGEDMTSTPTHQRNIGMVFQSLALFTHLSVGQNIAYALRIRGIAREAQDKRAQELLEMVHLGGFADRPVA